jgi:hypothetical protein
MPDDDLSDMNDVLLRGGGWPRGPGSYSNKFLRKVNALQAKETGGARGNGRSQVVQEVLEVGQ